MSDLPQGAPVSTSPRLFVGEFDRVADSQGRIQLPDAWIHDDPQEFLVRYPSFSPEVITVYPPDFLLKAVAELTTLNTEPLIELGKVGTQFRQVVVDRNGRLPLSDASLKEILVPEGKSAPVKLLGSVYCFSLCPAKSWPLVKKFMDAHVGSSSQQPAAAADS